MAVRLAALALGGRFTDSSLQGTVEKPCPGLCKSQGGSRLVACRTCGVLHEAMVGVYDAQDL